MTEVTKNIFLCFRSCREATWSSISSCTYFKCL